MTSTLADNADVLTVRPARTPADLAAAGALFDAHTSLLGEHVSADLAAAQPGAAAERADLGGHFNSPGALLLARHCRRTVGMAGVLPAGPHRFEVTRCYVHPDAQGTGIGRGLLRAAVRWAVRHGADRLVLDTLHAVMPAAAALYRSFGFEVTATRTVPGVPVPVVTMTLDLP